MFAVDLKTVKALSDLVKNLETDIDNLKISYGTMKKAILAEQIYIDKGSRAILEEVIKQLDKLFADNNSGGCEVERNALPVKKLVLTKAQRIVVLLKQGGPITPNNPGTQNTHTVRH